MSTDDPTPPVADDDFPEFAEPPRHRPPAEPKKPEKKPAADDPQAQVDDVIARLRRERAERERP
ncbi:MAG: hypothetical protein J7518_18925 [Nocardioidaceae bacterium]|nr:hypothetical protein [Nocardioidaceae bacterium]